MDFGSITRLSSPATSLLLQSSLEEDTALSHDWKHCMLTLLGFIYAFRSCSINGKQNPRASVSSFQRQPRAHTLINAAVSLLAQSSLAQLYLPRAALLQRPFPVTVTLLAHSVPASQKLPTSIYRAWLSSLAQASLASLACPALSRGCGTQGPRSTTGTSTAWPLSCPHPTAGSMGRTQDTEELLGL